jgi:ribosomal protein S19E (S16A)
VEKHTPSGETGLSRLQRRILRQLQARAAWIRVSGDIRVPVILDMLGAPWRPSVGRKRWTAAKRRAYSMALRHLEQRGLLLRVRRGRKASSQRTSRVRIIP